MLLPIGETHPHLSRSSDSHKIYLAQFKSGRRNVDVCKSLLQSVKEQIGRRWRNGGGRREAGENRDRESESDRKKGTH